MSNKRSKKDCEIDDYLFRLGVYNSPRPIRVVSDHWVVDRVTARPRRLRANWSIELAEDMMAMHGVDMEEISRAMAREMDEQFFRAITGENNGN